MFLRELTMAQILVRFLKPFFSTSLFKSTWIPLPYPCSRPSTLSRIANTSLTTTVAFALQDRPHLSESLSSWTKWQGRHKWKYSRSIYILGLIDKKTKRLSYTFSLPMYLGVKIVISLKKKKNNNNNTYGSTIKLNVW